tara:strand:- start:84 stop:959 length:876 start_codon:yes stop_codon:yes gene_type:complete
MSVYLGTFGEVELKREFDGSSIIATVENKHVNVNAKRFTFDFDFAQRQLMTGDEVVIESKNGSTNLSFISGYARPKIERFVNVDEVGGIRLYSTFAQSIAGDINNAIALASISSDIEIKVRVQDSNYKVLARVQNYELNTQRDTVDVTTLSDQFKNSISSLISGSGRMACEWEYAGETVKEIPNYLLELLLRTKVGSSFQGRFYIKTANYNPANHPSGADDSIWYEFQGILTACALQFTPAQLVQITADFVTTNAITLRMDLEDRFDLLLEDGSFLLLEQGSNFKLNLEQT